MDIHKHTYKIKVNRDQENYCWNFNHWPWHRGLTYVISKNPQTVPNLVVMLPLWLGVETAIFHRFSLYYFIEMGNGESNNSQTHVR